MERFAVASASVCVLVIWAAWWSRAITRPHQDSLDDWKPRARRSAAWVTACPFLKIWGPGGWSRRPPHSRRCGGRWNGGACYNPVDHPPRLQIPVGKAGQASPNALGDW